MMLKITLSGIFNASVHQQAHSETPKPFSANIPDMYLDRITGNKPKYLIIKL